MWGLEQRGRGRITCALLQPRRPSVAQVTAAGEPGPHVTLAGGRGRQREGRVGGGRAAPCGAPFSFSARHARTFNRTLSTNHAKNKAVILGVLFSLKAPDPSRGVAWPENPGEISWHRRMPWCYYPRNEY